MTLATWERRCFFSAPRSDGPPSVAPAASRSRTGRLRVPQAAVPPFHMAGFCGLRVGSATTSGRAGARRHGAGGLGRTHPVGVALLQVSVRARTGVRVCQSLALCPQCPNLAGAASGRLPALLGECQPEWTWPPAGSRASIFNLAAHWPAELASNFEAKMLSSSKRELDFNQASQRTRLATGS
jgi:hypothetical protein